MTGIIKAQLTEVVTMELKEIQRRLAKRNMTACARDTGIAYPTISNIQRGITRKPKQETLAKIIKWIEEN